MNIITKSAAVAVLSMSFAAPAFAMSDASMSRLISMGFDAEVVKTLSDKQLAQIERELHNGSDSDARAVVNSLLLNAMMKMMMDQ